jgi:hypothetical protein
LLLPALSRQWLLLLLLLLLLVRPGLHGLHLLLLWHLSLHRSSWYCWLLLLQPVLP